MRQFLGEPFHMAATVVCVVILIIWLLRFAGLAGGNSLRTLW